MIDWHLFILYMLRVDNAVSPFAAGALRRTRRWGIVMLSSVRATMLF